MPRVSYILVLDGETDVLAARDVLRGRAHFHGDVPAAVLSTGLPQDVGGYFRMLIQRVGDDGDPIVGSGCCAPCNVKPDNFRAMLEAVKNPRG